MLLRNLRLILVVSAVITAAGTGSGVLSAPSEAHPSNYCGHANLYGGHWLSSYYDYHNYYYVNRSYGSTRYTVHQHLVPHYYRPSAIYVYGYSHPYTRTCAVYPSYFPAFVSGISAVPVSPCILADDCESGGLPLEGEVPVDTAGGAESGDEGPVDQAVCKFTLTLCPVLLPPAAQVAQAGDFAQTARSERAHARAFQHVRLSPSKPLLTAQRLRKAGFSVRWMLLRGLGRGTAAHQVLNPPVAGCVTAVVSAKGSSIMTTPVPRKISLEVAGRRLARRIGHQC